MFSAIELSEKTIGVIIGSCIAAISGIIAAIIQGVIASFVESKRRKTELAKLEVAHEFSQSELKERERLADYRELLHKREKAYLDFTNLYGRVVTAVAYKITVAGLVAKDNSAQNASNNAVQAQNELGTFLVQHSDAITAIKLYGSARMICLMENLMIDFYNVTTEQGITVERIYGLDRHLAKVTQEMNSEIAQFAEINKNGCTS